MKERKEEKRERAAGMKDRDDMPRHQGEHGKKVKGGGSRQPHKDSGVSNKEHGPRPNQSD